VTEFVTISRASPRAVWLALRPVTGRTHQLRAHMLAIGHPILGDPKYYNAASLELSGELKLQLHARRIVLPHPTGGGELEIEAPISPELKAGFERFGFEEHEAPDNPFGGRRRG
jgi:23S rRNA pseudouridine955/2504/2580 synthase